MKHCKNCNYCKKDMVAEYLKGLDLYKCEFDGHYISDPFWEKCEHYTKDNFKGSLLKSLSDMFV